MRPVVVVPSQVDVDTPRVIGEILSIVGKVWVAVLHEVVEEVPVPDDLPAAIALQ